MKVIEQTSKSNGNYVETKFDTGATCYHYRDGHATYCNAGGRILNSVRNAKLIAKMSALAAQGIR